MPSNAAKPRVHTALERAVDTLLEISIGGSFSASVSSFVVASNTGPILVASTAKQ